MTTSIAEKIQLAYHTISLAHKAGQSLRRMKADAPSLSALTDVVAERRSNWIGDDDTLFFRPVFANPETIHSARFLLRGVHENDLLTFAQKVIQGSYLSASTQDFSFDASPIDGHNLYTHKIRSSTVVLISSATAICMRDAKLGTHTVHLTPALAWAKGYVAAVEAGETPPLPKDKLISTYIPHATANPA